MKKTAFGAILLCCAGSLVVTGCARNISANTYKAGKVGEAAFTYQGTVLSVREVEVKDSEKLEENALGIIGGGAIGGLAGNQVGKGRGQTIATIGGALLGATAGAFAEDQLKTQHGLEIVVRLTNGSVMTVVQGNDLHVQAGQPVLVMVSANGGRSRVVPDSGYMAQEVQPYQMTPGQTVTVNHNRNNG